MTLESDQENMPLFDKISRVLTGVLSFALLIISVAFFHVGVTFVFAFTIAFFAVKWRPVAPLYLAIASLPILIGLSFVAENGNAWDSLIQRVAAFVMFMILFGGYAMITQALRNRIVGIPTPVAQPTMASRFDYSEELDSTDEADEYDDDQQIVFEHQASDDPVQPAPAKTKAAKKSTPKKRARAPKLEPIPSQHHVDLSAMTPKKTPRPEPVKIPVTKLAARKPTPTARPTPATRLKAAPVRPAPKPTNVTDLRNVTPGKPQGRSGKLISG